MILPRNDELKFKDILPQMSQTVRVIKLSHQDPGSWSLAACHVSINNVNSERGHGYRSQLYRHVIISQLISKIRNIKKILFEKGIIRNAR